MFRLPLGDRVDPMEEKRQARENTISSVITFAVLCAAIRIVALGTKLAKALAKYMTTTSCQPCGKTQ